MILWIEGEQWSCRELPGWVKSEAQVSPHISGVAFGRPLMVDNLTWFVLKTKSRVVDDAISALLFKGRDVRTAELISRDVVYETAMAHIALRLCYAPVVGRNRR